MYSPRETRACKGTARIPRRRRCKLRGNISARALGGEVKSRRESTFISRYRGEIQVVARRGTREDKRNLSSLLRCHFRHVCDRVPYASEHGYFSSSTSMHRYCVCRAAPDENARAFISRRDLTRLSIMKVPSIFPLPSVNCSLPFFSLRFLLLLLSFLFFVFFSLLFLFRNSCHEFVTHRLMKVSRVFGRRKTKKKRVSPTDGGIAALVSRNNRVNCAGSGNKHEKV